MFENSRFVGVMLGLRNDVTGCGESMQEMLYGMYCNASFWDDDDDGANTGAFPYNP